MSETEKQESSPPPPLRRSDVIESQWEGAFIWGGLGLLALIFGLLTLRYGKNWGKFGSFEGIDFTPIGYLLLAGGIVLFIIGASKGMASRKVTGYTASCPYCGHDMEFVSQPMNDFPCEECHRRVPVLDGRILDITGVRCGFCGALNFMSEKTKVLICEECDREIPLLDAETGEMRHVAKGFARVDDDSLYELVLVAVGKEKEEITNTLQHMLAMTRAQVKDLLGNLPAVLLRGINRRKAEMLRAQIEANDGTAELRQIPK